LEPKGKIGQIRKGKRGRVCRQRWTGDRKRVLERESIPSSNVKNVCGCRRGKLFLIIEKRSSSPEEVGKSKTRVSVKNRKVDIWTTTIGGDKKVTPLWRVTFPGGGVYTIIVIWKETG